MNELDVLGPTAPVYTPVIERLRRRREVLALNLSEVEKLITTLEKNPETLELLDAMRRVGL